MHEQREQEGSPADAVEEAELGYEAALALVGTGRAQRRLLFICGLGNAADAVELLAVSLVLPAIGEQGRGSLRLSVAQLASLSAALFWGALVGTVRPACLAPLHRDRRTRSERASPLARRCCELLRRALPSCFSEATVAASVFPLRSRAPSHHSHHSWPGASRATCLAAGAPSRSAWR